MKSGKWHQWILREHFSYAMVGGSCLILLVALAATYGYWQQGERDRASVAVVRRLESIANSRKKAVRTWLAERKADAQALAWDPDLIELCVEGTCPKGMDPSRLQSHLDNQRFIPGFVGAYLFTPSGETLLVAEGGLPPCSEAEAEARLAVRERRFVLHDIDECSHGIPKIGFLYPIFQRVDPEQRREGAPVLGVIGLYIDPRVTLFPLLEPEGIRGPLEEVHLVRAEGNQVRILSPLRGLDDSLGPMPLPGDGLGELERIGAGDGERAGRFVDFRGTRVFAAARWISEAGWGLIAKVDERRALAAWRRAAWMEAGLSGAILLCLLLGGLALWRGLAGRRYRLLLENVRDREERLRALAHGTEDVVFFKNTEGRYLLVNVAAAQMLGAAPGEAEGRTARDFLEPELADSLEVHDRMVLEQGTPFQGEEVIPVGGVPHTYLASRIPFRDSQGELQGVAGVLRDITARKQNELELKRWAQTLGALYRLARNLTVAESRESIFSRLLDGAIDAFAGDVAGIFLLEADGHDLLLVDGRNVPATVREHYARIPSRFGIAAKVLRSGKLLTVEDSMEKSHRLAAFAAEIGVRSMAAIPLHAGEGLLGILGLGFRGPRLFTAVEGDALETLGHIAGVALDRSRAVESLFAEAEVRLKAEERLRRLHDATADLTGEDLFYGVARALSQELNARLVMVNEISGQHMVVPHVALLDGELVDFSPVPAKGTPCGAVVQTRSMVLLQDDLQEVFSHSAMVRDLGFRSYAGIPLCNAQEQVVGDLCVFSDQVMPLGEAEQEILELYARRVAGEMERMVAEQRLAETERVLRTLIENLPGAVYRSHARPERQMEFISTGVIEVTGYGPGELLDGGAVVLGDLIVTEDRSRVWREIQAAMQAGQPFEVEYRIHDAQGAIRWIYDVGRAVSSGEQEIIALEGVLFDHTERRSLEAQLIHSQRMDALGRLAGGVAHDFNNLLTAISGYAELLAARLAEGDRSQKAVGEIMRATDRAAELTRQLLAFGRRQVMEPKLVDINEVARAVARMVERVIGENITWCLELCEEVASVRVDPGQVEQVLLNLVVNARDAMPTGGELKVSTHLERLTRPREVPQGMIPKGEYLLLEVADTGVGMSAEVVQHIFEPFYTTKDKNTSTGLGLATVYGVLAQSGGYVAVQSQTGRGTLIQTYWPCAEGGDAHPEQKEPVGGNGEGQILLLVEDEQAVRDVAADHLIESGYRVSPFSSGEEALRAVQGMQHLDGVVTDVMMTGIRGTELVSRLRSRWPWLPVVYISGHTGDVLGDIDVAQPHTAFLQKPFRLQDLSQIVQRVLACAEPAGGGVPPLSQ